jgi:hypothetical protein
VQAPVDPGYAEFKSVQDAATRLAAAVRPRWRGRSAAAPVGAAGLPACGSTTSPRIPGVIAAGQQWKFLWQEVGNNGDGILWAKGGLLLAQNDNSQVLKLDDKGKASVAFRDTTPAARCR